MHRQWQEARDGDVEARSLDLALVRDLVPGVRDIRECNPHLVVGRPLNSPADRIALRDVVGGVEGVVVHGHRLRKLDREGLELVDLSLPPLGIGIGVQPLGLGVFVDSLHWVLPVGIVAVNRECDRTIVVVHFREFHQHAVEIQVELGELHLERTVVLRGLRVKAIPLESHSTLATHIFVHTQRTSVRQMLGQGTIRVWPLDIVLRAGEVGARHGIVAAVREVCGHLAFDVGAPHGPRLRNVAEGAAVVLLADAPLVAAEVQVALQVALGAEAEGYRGIPSVHPTSRAIDRRTESLNFATSFKVTLEFALAALAVESFHIHLVRRNRRMVDLLHHDTARPVQQTIRALEVAARFCRLTAKGPIPLFNALRAITVVRIVEEEAQTAICIVQSFARLGELATMVVVTLWEARDAVAIRVVHRDPAEGADVADVLARQRRIAAGAAVPFGDAMRSVAEHR
mmetsp:Transcript_46830/g.133836  ORF Transcript_46830/g.133836 Transcript_46830/m.133836 type:complete len:457 (-) Transcript_46830:405-1775(-)